MRLSQITPVIALLVGSVAYSAPISYFAVLNGPNEFPANASPGTGFANVTVDVVAHTMFVHVTFADLLGPNIASHIHCCTTTPEAGTAAVSTTTPTFTGFPSGTTSGSYDHTFDMTLASSYRAGYLALFGGSTAAAEADLTAGMAAGRAYLNIHSTIYQGGEIRGFLEPVPEPSTLFLAGAALVSLTVLRRRRRA